MILRFSRPLALTARSITAQDAFACAEIHAAAFNMGWSATEFENLASSQNVIAEGRFKSGSDSMVGFVLSRVAAGEAELLTIAVDLQMRRKGIGRGMLERHIETLWQASVSAVFLEVAEDNAAAISLYDTFAFREIGHRPDYYRDKQGKSAHAKVMKLELS